METEVQSTRISGKDGRNRRELTALIEADMNARILWASRQKIWYDMRHNGLRRKYLPFPGAADMHYPLADSIIDELKPYYFQQIYGSELIAQFSPFDGTDKAMSTAAEMWFDYQIRQSSNLEWEIQHCIDAMLMRGICVVKLTWDVDASAIIFDAIEPFYIVVPSFCPRWEDLTRMCHVMRLPVDAYRDNPEYNQDEDFVKSITGRGDNESQIQMEELTKKLREGLNIGQEDDEIVVWEVYEKVKGVWYVHTFSPLKPEADVKPTIESPFSDDKGNTFLPFVPFVTEIKDKGFYSPRGIPERIAPFETSLCKLWNEKLDCMTFYNRPLFTAEQEVPNTINLRFNPGQILPYGIKPVVMPQPPISFDQEMTQGRLIAQQLIKVPDLGVSDPPDYKEGPSATLTNAQMTLSGNNMDQRARIFRLSLGRLFQYSWFILRDYKFDDLTYYQEGIGGSQIQPEVLQQDYFIKPSGSADGINKPLLYQKAIARKQMFSNDPNIDQVELDKSILEIDDPHLIPRLIIDPKRTQTDQAELAASESLLLDSGYPVVLNPNDDDAIHAITHFQREEALKLQGKPNAPNVQNLAGQHIQAHIQRLYTKNPQQAAAVKKQIMETIKMHNQPQPAGAQ